MPVILKSSDGVLDAGDQAAFDALALRLKTGGKPVLLHLHGGLVSEAQGVAIAERLAGPAPDGFGLPAADWEEIFVVWRTDVLTELQRNWPELFANDRLYRILLRKLVEFISGRMKLPGMGGRSLGAARGLDAAEIARRLNARPAGDPFADLEEASREAGGARGLDDEAEDDVALTLEFQAFLANDDEFNAAVAPLDAALNRQAEGRSPPAADNALVAEGEQQLARLNGEVRAPIEALKPDPGVGRFTAVGVAAFFLRHAAKIAMRVIGRLRSKRDHGLYATICEEVVRELYGDYVGARVWGMMKENAARHFSEPGRLGSALLASLPDDARLMVTAHSAGAIWAAELLKAIAATGRPIALDLVLLAPAARMDLFTQAIAAAPDAVSRCRTFTMSDQLERADAVLGHDKGYIYPSSLLYLVSGLFEEQASDALVDAPLVGLQRFLGGAQAWLTQADQRAAVDGVVQFFQQPKHDIVYAMSCAGPGRNTQSDSHGGFDSEPATVASIAFVLTQWAAA